MRGQADAGSIVFQGLELLLNESGPLAKQGSQDNLVNGGQEFAQWDSERVMPS